MRKAVFYGRYSSVNQTEQSIEGQLHVCERYAEQHDIKIVAQYIDRATSGTSDKRQEFQRMIADSRKQGFEAVLVYKLDRFARNRYDSALYKKKLRENGVRVVSATENITDTPEGIIMEGLLESMDEYYSAELSRKCKRGLKESFDKGRFIGCIAPYGYQVTDHYLQVNPATAPIAQQIFQRYADGERQADIIADLNQRNIPNASGRQWNTCNISKMLQNTVYIGQYSVSTMKGISPCPAIITQEVFDKVQEHRARCVHESRKNRTNFNYILTGKAVCGECGHPVCGHSTDKGARHYYRCSKCCHSAGKAVQLHETVKGALQEYLTEEKLTQLANAAYTEYQKEENAPTNEYDILKQDLTAVEKKLQNAVDALLSGLNSERVRRTIEELEQKQTELTERLNAVSAPAPIFTQEHFRIALKRLIANAQAEDLKELVDTIVDRIIVKDKQAIICINITNETNEPPLEQILCMVKDSSVCIPTRSNTMQTADATECFLASL